MFRLILKDLLVLRQTTFLISMIIMPVLIFVSKGNTDVLSAYFVIATYVWIMSLCQVDERNKSDILLNSLPIKRTTIVSARYLSIFVFTGINFIIYFFVSKILSLPNLSITFSPLTLSDFLFTISAIVIFNCIYFPFYFKYGYAKTGIINFTLLFSLFYLKAFLEKSVPGKLEKIMSNLHFLKFDFKYKCIISLGILFLIFISSLALSINIYKNREF